MGKRSATSLFFAGIQLFFLGCPSPVLGPVLSPSPLGVNAGLAGLTVSSGALTPAFAPGILAYTVSVPNTTASITVTGTRADPNATLSANSGVAQSLGVGTSTITLTVTAQDGVATRNYVVTVHRQTLVGLTIISVPAGRFQRDSGATNISEVGAFRMSQHEITRAQFVAIMGVDPSSTAISSGSSHPLQFVNWYHAIAFCNKLSIAEGLTPVYTVSGVNFNTLTFADVPIVSNPTWDAVSANWGANGYRLPTEMEWMWAAMGAPLDGQGGGVNTTGYLKGYAGSSEVGGGQVHAVNFAWYNVNSGGVAHPVGTLTANELGIFDMSGNVWEWSWDWHALYPSGTLTDYRGVASGLDRTRRGGGWVNNPVALVLSHRSVRTPFYRSDRGGIRVVRL